MQAGTCGSEQLRLLQPFESLRTERRQKLTRLDSIAKKEQPQHEWKSTWRSPQVVVQEREAQHFGHALCELDQRCDTLGSQLELREKVVQRLPSGFFDVR
jgi:hypothetical protein